MLPVANPAALVGGCMLRMDKHGEIEWQKDLPSQASGSADNRVRLSADDVSRHVKLKKKFNDVQLIVPEGLASNEKNKIGYWLPNDDGGHCVVEWPANRLPPGVKKCPLVSSRQHVLFFSGNPAKFLQGHNVVGLPARFHSQLLRDVILRADQQLGFGIDWPADVFPAFMRKRNDITISLRLGYGDDGQQAVLDWLMGLPVHVSSRHRTNAKTHAHTVYFGKHSRRWSLKCYSKLLELRNNKKAHEFCADGYRRLCEWSAGVVRIELTLRALELAKQNMITEELVYDFWSRLNIGGNGMQQHLNEDKLNSHASIALDLWRRGDDVKSRYPRSTFYRLRQQIKDSTGIDINLPPPNQTDGSKSRTARQYTTEFIRAHEADESSVSDLVHQTESPSFWDK